MNRKTRKILPATLTLLIVGLIAISGPASAITAYLGAIADAVLGETVTLMAYVTVQDEEFLSQDSVVNLTINLPPANGSSFWCSLPKATGSSTVTCSNGEEIDVTASTSTSFDYGYAYGYLYGYAYQAYAYAYGYGYDYQNAWIGSTLNYSIQWTIPYDRFTNVSYPTGVYNASIAVTGGTSSDVKTFTVTALPSQADQTLVRISELMINPADDNGELPATNGEWVELYNPGATSVDVNGWTLTDYDGGTARTIDVNHVTTGSTTIAAGGFLVVYKNGTDGVTLNNDEDTITLKNASGSVIDVVSYDATDFNSSIQTGGSFRENVTLGQSTDGLWTAFQTPTEGTSNPGMLATETQTWTLYSGWNLRAQYVNNTNSVTASDVMDATNCSYIGYYTNNGSSSSYISYRQNPINLQWTGSNFTLEAGRGYYIKCNASSASSYSMDGESLDSALSNTVYATWNMYGWRTAANSSASEVVDSIGSGVTYIGYYWNNGTSNNFVSWRLNPVNSLWTGSNFTVSRGYGYFIKTNTTYSWER